MSIRPIKMILCLSLAAFAFLVTVNNVTDYQSNYAFVRHVLSMDTTFPGNALMYRAITEEALWHAAYWLIIAGEAATCLALLAGTLQLWKRRHASGAVFNAGKRCVLVGCTIGFVVWFVGFLVIGGEWFVMWQSPTWKGQDAAFRFCMTIIGVMIFVNQPDIDTIEAPAETMG
ncbi:DUF2165 family protein [Herbaspirillum sp. RV1423]|uniref:DUF2165 family protein n=1 Tax=Herbaspirillum sp. RV1423 TaxID=1443993 RepID=UPI0004AEF7FE|nr:DUF2165 domain-containing protein [Herbaspirillum sp. RV1423]